MSTPYECPSCKASLDGGEIPERHRSSYSPPYRWSRAISVYCTNRDRHSHWQCPDCKHEWGHVFGLPVDYATEVTAEQAAAIDRQLAPEFAGGDWQTVEKEQ